MQQWTEGDVVVRSASGLPLRLHYYRTGKGSLPVVVLSHGITDNGLCWTPVARALESEYDVIMYDTRGHGLSERPMEPYRWEDLAGDLAGLIEALELERPLVMGHSLGAATALLLAASYPGATRAIILEDPPASEDTRAHEGLAPMVEERRAELAELKATDEVRLLASLRERSPTWAEDELEPWVLAKKQVSPNVAEIYGAPRPDWREAVKGVACPSLWITADPERGAIVTPEVAAEVKALLPSAQVVRIDKAGHCIHREQFDAVMASVKSFLHDVASA